MTELPISTYSHWHFNNIKEPWEEFWSLQNNIVLKAIKERRNDDRGKNQKGGRLTADFILLLKSRSCISHGEAINTIDLLVPAIRVNQHTTLQYSRVIGGKGCFSGYHFSVESMSHTWEPLFSSQKERNPVVLLWPYSRVYDDHNLCFLKDKFNTCHVTITNLKVA